MNIGKQVLFLCITLGLLFLSGCTDSKVKGSVAVDAVKKGDVATIEKYLGHNGDANLKNKEGDSLLMLAAYYGYPVIVEDLIKAGADINAKNNDHTVLEFACSRNSPNLDVVELLLEAGAEVTDEALMSAIRSNYVKIVRALLQAGADVNAQEGDPLRLACNVPYNGHEMMELLLQAGADVNAKNKSGYTALMEVSGSVRSNVDKVKLLLESGADVNAKDARGETALVKAAYWLHKVGEDAKDESHQQKIPDLGIDRVHAEIVKMLVQTGADVNAKNIEGETTLMQVSTLGRIKEVKLLLEAGANVDAVDLKGETALIKASKLGHIETVKLLLQAGANVNAKNIDGDTAISIARHKEHTDVVKVLKAAGAKSM